jgi:hypothetical protein
MSILDRVEFIIIWGFVVMNWGSKVLLCDLIVRFVVKPGSLGMG